MMTYNGDEMYTQEEMTRYTRGWEALSAAVIKQWIKDGRPGGCDLQPWYDMLAVGCDLHNPPPRGGVATAAWFNEK